MGAWNWLDGALAAVVVASVVAAVLRGFVRELIALATVVVGLVVAALGYQRVAVWFEDLTRSHDVALGAGFLALLLATLALGALVALVARKLVKTAGLQSFDRVLGGIFGLIRGAVLDCVLLLVLVAFGIKPVAVQQSLLAPYVTTGARVLVLMMPGDLKARFQTGFEHFRQTLIQHDKNEGRD